MKKPFSKSRLGNQKGQITVDFLFSIVLAFGLGAIFFSFVLTLTVSEITQYVTFSAARAQAGSQYNKSMQCNAALRKYSQLTSGSSTLTSFYKNGWFKIDQDPDVRSGDSGDSGSPCKDENFSDSFAADPNANFSKVYTGVSTKFTSLLLDFKIPFIGSTDSEGEGFNTNVTTNLIREPSHVECVDYFKARQNALKNRLPSSEYVDLSKVQNIVAEDNGC